LGESFKDLIVWQRAVDLSVCIYSLTGSFPSAEKFGLTSQMRRAAVSIVSNIAEGYGRSTRGEYIQFVGHARGSVCELQSQLVIAERLGFGSMEHYEKSHSLSSDVSRMLNALMRKLKS
jgi:four helix bundle protein